MPRLAHGRQRPLCDNVPTLPLRDLTVASLLQTFAHPGFIQQ